MIRTKINNLLMLMVTVVLIGGCTSVEPTREQRSTLGPDVVAKCQGANVEHGLWIIKRYQQGTSLADIATETGIPYEILLRHNNLWYPDGSVTTETGEFDPSGFGNVCIIQEPY